MKGFPALTVIGVADALIHWQVFFVLCSAAGLTQAASNFAAFCVAAAFSFYVNMLYTFDSKTSVYGYLLFIGLMAGASFGIGSIADMRGWHGLLTVTVFTVLNLTLGCCFFRFLLFRQQRT
jgi:putative flippase GtrA